MLEIHELEKSFGALCVTKKASFKLEKGERRVILGPNGAGKTTLFNQLVGEISPDSGAILMNGQDITRLSIPERTKRGLSRSYQKNTLFDELTIYENIAVSAAIKSGWATSLFRDSFKSSEVQDIVADVAEQVMLTSYLDNRVSEVSYGIRRQLEVGVAIATRPRVLLMDEPTSGIGPEMQHNFHKMLDALPRDMTLLIIEHDMDLAFQIADTITVLNYGEVVFDGTPEDARGSQLLKEIYLGSWENA